MEVQIGNYVKLENGEIGKIESFTKIPSIFPKYNIKLDNGYFVDEYIPYMSKSIISINQDIEKL